MVVRSVTVEPRKLAAIGEATYDAMIAVVGFETRSRFFAESSSPTASKKIAGAFSSRQRLAFQDNMNWYREAGYEISVLDNNEYASWIDQTVSNVCAGRDRSARVCVDISSTSRLRMAALISALIRSNASCDIEVDFVYSFGKYGTSIPETVVTEAGPVIPFFAGWSLDPSLPVAAVFGLGYERDKAVGVLEYLEPGEVWAFEPVSDETEYVKAIKKANQSFYDGLTSSHILSYPVKSPYTSYVKIESFAYGLRDRRRLVFLPFGPKLFALISLLIASSHYPKIAVWRVTGEESEQPVDRLPTGEVVALKATFSPSRTQLEESERMREDLLSS